MTYLMSVYLNIVLPLLGYEISVNFPCDGMFVATPIYINENIIVANHNIINMRYT